VVLLHRQPRGVWVVGCKPGSTFRAVDSCTRR
jgi:hypothetical protein